jgi:hypothetical protein
MSGIELQQHAQDVTEPCKEEKVPVLVLTQLRSRDDFTSHTWLDRRRGR